MGKKHSIPTSFQMDVNDFYNAIVSSTESYIYIINMIEDVALVSDNMFADFDLPSKLVENLIGVWKSLIHYEDQDRFQENIDDVVSNKIDQHNLEYRVRNRKQEYIWVVCRGVLMKNKHQQTVSFAGVVTPLGGRGKVDYTSGLLVQGECKNKIELRKDQGYTDGGFLLLGVDDFSRLNNLRNHTFGDSVLRTIAQKIVEIAPMQASVYRYDGDEMGVFYPDATLEDMKKIYQCIQIYANHQQEVDDIPYICTISGGIAMLGKDCMTYLDLIKCAMSALESSKKNGKNKCTVFAPKLLEDNIHTMEIISDIQRSIVFDLDGFSLVYQPLMNAKSEEVMGAEALLRWKSAKHKEIGPTEFIPLLEADGSIIAVGRWVMEQAFRTCKEWVLEIPDFVMNVNVSYLQMVEEGFVDMVIELLAQNELDSKHIVLELTESYFASELQLLKSVFQQLRDQGIRFAMDDFGTGYSSLGMLSQSFADIIKIDRMFISYINDQEHAFNRSFIEAVIKLCHSIGISVCVEGVEHNDEYDVVRDMMVDTIQGYYVSRPIQKNEFERVYFS